jgi:hypothetical protein
MRNNPGLGTVPQIMKPWRCVGATIHPAEAVTQRVEDTLSLSLPKGLSQPSTTTAHQERDVGVRGNLSFALPPITR